MVGRQQCHTCLRKRARNATAACKCAACLWGFAEEDRPSQPHLWEEAGVSLRQRPGKLRGLNQTAGCRRPPRGQSAEIQSCPPRPPLVQGEQGVPPLQHRVSQIKGWKRGSPSATLGIIDKGMEKGFRPLQHCMSQIKGWKRGSPSATLGITDKGMEKGFLLCNTGCHR